MMHLGQDTLARAPFGWLAWIIVPLVLPVPVEGTARHEEPADETRCAPCRFVHLAAPAGAFEVIPAPEPDAFRGASQATVPNSGGAMQPAVTPFLMFEGQQAQQAMELYTRVIPDSRILDVQRHGPDGPGPEGSVLIASISLRGQTVMVSDSYISHGFTFTPSISLFVTCADDAEIERLAAELGEGGKTLMPLDSYGFSQRFTWVEDRFGVSWQLNLP